MKRLKDESGNVAIEAVFVVTITIITICILIMFGFLYYQKSLLQAVANETATQMGRTYSYESKDPFIGYISEEKLLKEKLFDYCYFFKSPSKEDAVSYAGTSSHSNDMVANESIEAAWFAAARLNQYRFMSANANTTTVSAKVYKSELVKFQSEIEVVISEEYSIPLLGFFGMTDPVKCEASSRAICTDMLNYYSMCNFISEVEKKLMEDSGASEITNSFGDVVAGATSSISLIKKGINYAKELLGLASSET